MIGRYEKGGDLNEGLFLHGGNEKTRFLISVKFVKKETFISLKKIF